MTDLTWQNNTPVSSQFDDVYFSAHNGIAETQHVFLKGNGLPERFSGSQRFTIGELGFGTGLNFWVTLGIWQEANTKGELHYISCEKFPLKTSNMEVFVSKYQRELPIKEDFLHKWNLIYASLEENTCGWHKMVWEDVTLHLYIGDVGEMLKTMPHKANAWFLDGFAPAKNPNMWSPNVFKAMAQQSQLKATLATYTAAGHVRRGLKRAGFDVRKEKGFHYKRDMTVGFLCDNLMAI